MNCVRRHLSAIKGGRLAAACHPARVVNLLISDVPGDRPMDIASGPTVADPSSCADALDIVRRYAIELPAGARALLESGAGETLKPGDARLAGVVTHLVATPQMALEAAAGVARAAGVTPLILGDSIEGEARDVGKVMAAIALQVKRHAQPLAAPCVLLSGGETTVTVRGTGRGGTPTASTGWRRSPAPLSPPTPWPAPGRWASARWAVSTTTTVTVSSRPSATLS